MMEGRLDGPRPRAWALLGPGSALVAVGIGVLALLLAPREIPLAGRAVLVWRTALPVAISGLLIAGGIARGHRASRVVFFAAVPFFLAAMAFFFLPGAKEARARDAEKVAQSALAFYGGSEEGTAGDAGAAPGTERLAKQAAEIAVLLAPAMEFLALLAVSAAAYALFAAALRRSGVLARPISGFGTWRAPFSLVWVFAAGLAGVLLGKTPVREIGANLLFFAAMVYLVQGIAVLAGQFRKRSVPAVFQVLFLAAAVFFALSVFLLMTVCMGLFDTWFDFRRLDRPSPQAGAR